MSIIHEAMKKTGTDKIDRTSISTPSAPRVEIRRAPAPASRSNVGLLIVVAALLLLGAFILTPASKALHMGQQPTAPGFTPNTLLASMRPAVSRISGQFGVEETPTSSAFTLSGVMVSDVGSYGIINNQIVGKGQAISGATVESISGQEVILNYNGQKIILPVTAKKSL